MCQIAEPVKPFTCWTPNLAAARALPDALRIAVAPDVRRQDPAVAVVDLVADRLPDEVRAEREAVQVVALEDLLDSADVVVLRERAVDLEVVAPAGELESVEGPAPRLLRELLERQVGPLAGEEGDRSGHRSDLTMRRIET